MSDTKKPGDLWWEGKDTGLHTSKAEQRDKLARELAELVITWDSVISGGAHGEWKEVASKARKLLKLYG